MIGARCVPLILLWRGKQQRALNKEVEREKIGGMDPGAPKNPKVGKKFLITTVITTIIFSVIYYLVNIDLLNLREFLK